jgi:hypothetical protein
MRYGELSRSGLKLLRVEWRDDTAACDWIARPPDPWDFDLRVDVRERTESLQALLDAIALRKALFSALPGIRSASLRGYRRYAADELPCLIIVGAVERDNEPPIRVPSLVMRAKLCGLHFSLHDGVLEALDHQERAFGMNQSTMDPAGSRRQ